MYPQVNLGRRELSFQRFEYSPGPVNLLVHSPLIVS